MIRCNPGDVVLLLFPFTSLTSVKKRPAVVLSPPPYQVRYGDVVLMALTSRPQEDAFFLKHWQEAGLPRPTWAKPLVGTFASSILDKQLGRLSQPDWSPVRNALAEILAPPCFSLPG
jgi:mRNA-degrading endonuclease toxin of MazEF toxin-antitoxin module